MKTKLLLAAIFLYGYASAQTIELDEFAAGFNEPIELVHAGDDRMFVVEQGGTVKILNPDGSINANPFLNISNLVSTGFEQGLLGLAFHPNYSFNRYFYVNYTDTNGDTVVARYTTQENNPLLADASSQMVILTVDQPLDNHNGGCLRFGQDGFLYIALGDGGGAGDPQNNAQNLNSLLGKILRINVDGGSPYSIPPGNPYSAVDGADEIWASGLRNPWKFSFNETNGDVWIADVGQDNVEEINMVVSTEVGANFGWRCYEGFSEFNTAGCEDIDVYRMPLAEYTHDATGGCSVTGGYVYNGSAYPNLQGKYLFSDFCHDMIGIVDTEGNISYSQAFEGNGFAAFGKDIDGELYVSGKTSGTIYRIIDSSLSTAQFSTETFYLYPNPARDMVQLRAQDEANLRIFDLGGKLLLQQQVASGDNSIATSSLQSGIYLVEVESSTAVHKQKLVIR